MKIDQIYIINLRTPPAELIARVNQLGASAGTRFLITEAIDGTDIRPLDYAWKPSPAWEQNNGALVPREAGRALSHINAWLDARKNGYGSILILEEHFLPDVLLSQMPEPPSGWELVLLAREKVASDDESATKAGAKAAAEKHFVKPSRSKNIRAYLLSSKGLAKLLAHAPAENLVPVDEFLSATFSEHPDKELAALFRPNVTAFASKKPAFREVAREHRPAAAAQPGILDDADWPAWKKRYVDPVIQGEPELVVDEVGPRFSNIFEFPLFTDRFCSELVALAESKNMWADSRHQFYPTNDTSLVNLGVNRMYARVLKEIVVPLAVKTWQLEGAGWQAATSENFIVRYTTTKQDHLSLHHDISEVTCVAKLNGDFDGGGTYFPRYGLCVVPRRVGNAFLHPGAVTHRHGARPIYSGKRYISVSFIKPRAAPT